jgi:CTP synthase (UTP-ammonia lyase)
VAAHWVATDGPDALVRASGADGLWVVPGSPYRDDAVVLGAISSARVSGQPFLGTCGGFQYAVLEFARNVAGMTDAAHGETDPEGAVRVVDRLACSLIGEERKVATVPGTKLGELLGDEPFVGFHYCNFGMSEMYADRLQGFGLVVGARGDDAGVEAIELPDHPFFMATLFQPQVGSLAGKPLNPLIDAFARRVRSGS